MNLFVWDFHGVLEKDCEFAVMEITNKVLEEFNIKKRINLKETKKLYGLKWSDYFRYCCPNESDTIIMKMVRFALKRKWRYMQPQELS